MSEARPQLRLGPPVVEWEDGHTMTMTLHVDLQSEHHSYRDWEREDPSNKNRQPFLDEVKLVATQIVSALVADGSIDANGITIYLRSGNVVVEAKEKV